MSHRLQTAGRNVTAIPGALVLEDGLRFNGISFGAPAPVSGEVVFNTGMVGYPEALTDPSYRGQILVFTYPLIGNYGVPDIHRSPADFESSRIQVAGLIVSEMCTQPNHWNAATGLTQWMKNEGVPGLSGVDTRSLTKRLRSHGTMMGGIELDGMPPPPAAGLNEDFVSQVTVPHPVDCPRGEKRVILVDCGCKESILNNLLERDLSVLRVPYDYDFSGDAHHGVVISNGPGDPKTCVRTIQNVRSALQRDIPVFGICLGSQILALAAGGDTYKLKYGHRGQNQPCIEPGEKRCYITSQNHGYAVDPVTLDSGWTEWFVNANDGTNEGIRHRTKPFRGVQFHPEAAPGPADVNFLFDDFVKQVGQR